jgi:hypothetical protein
MRVVAELLIENNLRENLTMTSFNLSTSFTQTDLERFLASGTNVVVAKPTGGGSPNVAWIVYRPLNNNAISWEENYGVYASNADVVHGATLSQMSATPYPAVAGMLYSMSASGAIIGPNSGGTANAYAIVNGYSNLPKGYLTMGLFQDATVDGNQLVGNAVSAAPVIFNSTATMLPFTTVYLWTQSQVVSNTVVTNVTSPMTMVKLSATNPSAALTYNAITGTFVPTVGGSGKKLDGNISEDLVEAVLPRL